ncbi:MAG TPA: hypothetical protein VHQ46_02385 [Desulfobacteria bacterium]|nr:hypothetical protein [Desulfobacteria bacterium]
MIGNSRRLWVMLAAMCCFVLLVPGCGKLQKLSGPELTLLRAKAIITERIAGVEYRAYVSIGARIGATAEDPEKFLAEIGLITYTIKQDYFGTWYVTSSLTPQGKQLFRPVTTIWGGRYAATVAKLELQSVDSLTLSPDGTTAVVQAKFTLEPVESELAHYLDPAKSVWENHNIHIEAADSSMLPEISWGIPTNRPDKIRLRSLDGQWKVDKLL